MKRFCREKISLKSQIIAFKVIGSKLSSFVVLVEMGNNRRVINTAIYYWRRFYYKYSRLVHCLSRVHFTDVHPYLAVPTCYYLASKVEEVATNVPRVLSSFEGVLKLHKIDPIKWTVDDVLSCESTILSKLDYCLLFFDPFRCLRHFLSLCHLEDCLQACTLLVFPSNK